MIYSQDKITVGNCEVPRSKHLHGVIGMQVMAKKFYPLVRVLFKIFVDVV